MHSLAGAAIHQIPQFGERELSNTPWAFSVLGVPHRPLLTSLSAQALPRIRQFQPRGLAGTAWALAALGVVDSPLFNALSASARAKISELKPQELGNMVWAMATLEVRDVPLMEALAAQSIPKISDFTPQELANTAWAYARLGVENGPLLPAISAVSRRQLPDFLLQELANLAWSYAHLGEGDAPLLHAIAAAAIPKLGVLQEAGESPMAAVALVEAFQTAEILHEVHPLLHEATAAIERCSGLLDSRVAVMGGAAGAPWGRGGDTGQPAIPAPATAEGGPSAIVGGGLPIVLAQRPPLLAIWKPPGWSVSVGGGLGRRSSEEEPDDGGGPRARGRPLEEWLSRRLPERHPIARDRAAQHGLLHRLDRETSGVLCCAVSYRGFYLGLLQFASRRVRKVYRCLCRGHPPSPLHFLEAPLLTEALWPGGPLRSRASARGRSARTEVRAVAHLSHADGEPFSLVLVHLHTGRTHQIRAHLGGEGHPLVGDSAYGGSRPAEPWWPRLFLHAARLTLDAGGGPFDVVSPLPDDLREALAALVALTRESRALMLRALTE
mmetsp:Transcript_54383/g.168727  ORF Transcript_54383/g.168727 Transcript_54383/m.168727 type:complete len:553 (+) Transcript_54383:298-1956(+)